MTAHLGEPRLTPEVIGSPKRAGSFRLKSSGGPGELEASLGKLGSRKLGKKTLLPFIFGIFHILDQNFEQYLILCGNWCWTVQFG